MIEILGTEAEEQNPTPTDGMADDARSFAASELAALLPDGTNGGVTADIHFRVRRVYRYDGETVAVSDVRY